ncbi:MAG: V-type ATP synthase subunit D [Verrucomicrobia bacterium]|nr:V-type ATP synthase subunit D [Verrucomicrobiota bacterium]
MAQLKLTKTELRHQQVRLSQLQKYLPTLQLKKALLQVEVNQSVLEIIELRKQYSANEEAIQKSAALFSEKDSGSFFSSISILEVKQTSENIAGVEIPVFEEVVFSQSTYSLFDTPVWYESAMEIMHNLLISQEKVIIGEKKKAALEKELRDVSIRVNLFEKIAIPRAKDNIKRIKIFLGDQQLAAVSQAKVSKKKILERALHDH